MVVNWAQLPLLILLTLGTLKAFSNNFLIVATTKSIYKPSTDVTSFSYVYFPSFENMLTRDTILAMTLNL